MTIKSKDGAVLFFSLVETHPWHTVYLTKYRRLMTLRDCFHNEYRGASEGRQILFQTISRLFLQTVTSSVVSVSSLRRCVFVCQSSVVMTPWEHTHTHTHTHTHLHTHAHRRYNIYIVQNIEDMYSKDMSISYRNSEFIHTEHTREWGKYMPDFC